jgi:hypothetical protein
MLVSLLAVGITADAIRVVLFEKMRTGMIECGSSGAFLRLLKRHGLAERL